MKSHKELLVWQKGIELVKRVYILTERFPDSEKFGLTSQMRRCAVSIPSNIAEGHARKGDTEFLRFLRIAYGSSTELETQLVIAQELQFTTVEDFATVDALLVEIRKMLNALMSTLAKS